MKIGYFGPRSIKQRMLLSFSALLIAALTIVQAANYIQSYIDIEENLAGAVNQSLQLGLRNIDYQFQDMDNLSNGVLSEPFILRALRQQVNRNDFATDTMLRTLDEIIQKYRNTRVTAQRVYLINTRGEVLDAALLNSPPDNLPELMNRRTGEGPLALSGIHRASYSNTGLEVISLVKSVYEPGKPSERLGTLVADLDAEAVKKTLDTFSLPRPGKLLLTGQDGQLVYEAHGGALPDLTAQQVMEASQDRPGKQIIRCGGRKYMSIRSTSEVTGWSLTAVIPYQDLMKTAIFQRNLILVLLAACILAATAISRLIVSRVYRPIQLVLRSMKQVEDGNLETSVDYASGDEMQRLVDGYNSMAARLRGLIEKVKREEASRHLAELHALQAQINPHFLYNTLNSIRTLARAHGEQDIRLITVALINLSRASLDSDRFIRIEQEVALVEDYVRIQKIRYGDIFSYSCELDPRAAGCVIPRFSIQPVVENALFHGILPNEGGAILVRITCEEEQGEIVITVEDDGAGMSEELLRAIRENIRRGLCYGDEQDGRKLKNIGLVNVHHRIRLYFSGDYGVSIGPRGTGGTLAVIRIPMKREMEVHSGKNQEADDRG